MLIKEMISFQTPRTNRLEDEDPHDAAQCHPSNFFQDSIDEIIIKVGELRNVKALLWCT